MSWSGVRVPPETLLYLLMDQDELGWVSKNMEWAIIPFGKKFMSIYCGQQISVHNSMDTAKKFVQKEMRKK